jgi:hypothetical protein
MPSSLNWTLPMPAAAVAVAETMIFPEMVVAAVGAVIVTETRGGAS